MNQETFIQKRDQWLEEVSNQCHEFALECDLDFYVFQTPCNKYNPELLIIGINPGGVGRYSKILREKGYTKRPASDLGYDVNTLTTKPQWEIDKKEKGANVMRERLRRVFNEENHLVETLENTVMMNLYYFNTQKQEGLNEVPKEAKDFCVTKTLEFIEILNPKNILFLTSDEKNLSQCKVTPLTYIGNNVKKGALNKYPVFTIPHYSYFGAYSTVKAAAMGKTLRELFQ